jgi:hypothetical protein
MKRTLPLLALLFLACTAQAQELLTYYTGVWYETKAPIGHTRSAGAIDVYFWDDGVITVDVIYNGEIVDYAEGMFARMSASSWKIIFAGQYGFTGVLKNRFISGTFKSLPLGSYKGKWQAN